MHSPLPQLGRPLRLSILPGGPRAESADGRTDVCGVGSMCLCGVPALVLNARSSEIQILWIPQPSIRALTTIRPTSLSPLTRSWTDLFQPNTPTRIKAVPETPKIGVRDGCKGLATLVDFKKYGTENSERNYPSPEL